CQEVGACVSTTHLAIHCFQIFSPSSAGSFSCSHLAVNSSVVILGGNITASCTIWRNHCPIAKNSKIQIIWKLSNQQLQGSQYSLSNGVEVSNITLGPFKEPMTPLSCCLQEHDIPQVVNLTWIQAGYPPGQPQNLTCIFNLTSKSLACQWDPGWDSLLPTHVALKGSRSRECKDLTPITDCIPEPGQHSCTFQRLELQLYQKMLFWVSVENALGNVTSKRLCADPVDLGGCQQQGQVSPALFSSQWASSCNLGALWAAGREGGKGRRLSMVLLLPFSLSSQVHNITTSRRRIQQCGFLFGSLYRFQMRCRRLHFSYWSSWSPAKLFTTDEKGGEGDESCTIQAADFMCCISTCLYLALQPMKPHEANGKILGYWAALSINQHTSNLLSLCNTTERQCTFLMPPGAKRIYLSAYNSRGASQPTEIFLLEKNGRKWIDSLWWDPPRTPATGYIIEWHQVGIGNVPPPHSRPSISTNTCPFSVSENIEPFQRYKISVYPLYRDRVGVPQSIEAYTRQKGEASHHYCSAALLLASETITKCCQCFPPGIAVNASVDTLTIAGLRPSKMYSLHLMTSTMGGSTNGTSLAITTKDMGKENPAASLSFCRLQLTPRMKTQFWPSVPDPANSSLGKWAPAVLQEVNLEATETNGCSSFTNLPPTVPTGGSGPTSYINNPESVQYAKVLGGSYLTQQEVSSPTIYVRSSSRQPLLRSLTPSPKLYKNLWFHSDQPEQAPSSSFQEETVFLDGALLDFPLLQGLKIDDDEDLCNFRQL
uniref:Colony stimulating factor 3 receptor n=1 Tax=Laticauda laticaudata TaxID=8630 RepID=A0A8C5RIZ5_LATLA